MVGKLGLRSRNERSERWMPDQISLDLKKKQNSKRSGKTRNHKFENLKPRQIGHFYS